jgi:DMSO/TMAO reductase YedYZ molybdopterin-dependent catalytic subunit
VPVAGGISKPRPDAYFRLGPPVAETRFEVMGRSGFTTPNGLFFVRNHTTSMVVDPKTWQLSVEGSGVDRPFTLSYDDLLKLPSTTVTRYVECAGNGRSFYQTFLNQPAQGGQWLLGGYGVAEWTGVRLGELLDRAGVKSTATEVMPVGLDQQQVRRPMPLAKAQEPDTLLVYGMNGDVLPIDHGFPARTLVPGWVGVNNIKWVGKILVTQEHNAVDWNTNLYILIGPDYQPQGEAKGPPINEQVMKAAVALPWPATLRAGAQQVSGYAWSPAGKISKVEVSTDEGRTFQTASLVEPNTERAGVRWQMTLQLTSATTSILPRATDETGKAQPSIPEQKWNEQGYLFGAAVPHPITVTG